MDTLSAWARGEANRGKELMVFDWNKAAEMIGAANPSVVRAGLQGDWEWTAGTIYENGKPITDEYTYLSSTWAVPEIEIDGVTTDCFVMQSAAPDWDSETKWPSSALSILESK